MNKLTNLPESWLLTTFEDVCDFHAGFGFPTEMQGRKGQALPFYKVRDVSIAWNAQSVSLLETEHSLSHDEAGFIKAKPVPKGVVVFAKIGEALRLNRRAITPKLSLIDNNLMGISAPTSLLAEKYLYWYSIKTRFDVNARASVVPSIRKSDVGDLPFPLAPLKEQTRIVAKLEELLSDLDAGVAELKAAQKKLAQYRQSLLKAAVEGGLTAVWRQHNPPQETGAQLLERILTERRARWEAKQIAKFASQGKAPPKGWQSKYPAPVAPDVAGLPQLPRGWVWATIDQLAAIGTGVTPLRSKSAYFDHGDIPWITSGALNSEAVFQATEMVTELALKECRLELYPVGALLVAMYGEGKTRGKCSELKIPATINQAIAALVLDGEAEKCKKYLKSFLLHSYEKMREQASGGVQPNLNLQIVRSIALPLPPTAEQSAIDFELSEKFQAVAHQEAALKFALKQSTAQRQNILRAAFSGQLVPQDPSDEPASKLLERIRSERAAQASAPKVRKARAVKGAA